MNRRKFVPDYTSRAINAASRYPVANFISIQVTFWILANLLFVLLTSMQVQVMAGIHNLSLPDFTKRNLLLAVVFGVIYGTILGFIDYYIEKVLSRSMPLLAEILLKAIISALLISALLFAVRRGLSHYIDQSDQLLNNPFAWRMFFTQLLIYNFAMSLIISFINQMNKRFGPGMLIPLLLGRFRKPHQENRIFMFMDLQSSTTIAESLGHVEYSHFISETIKEINQAIAKYSAVIFQYVGDEVVLTWRWYPGFDMRKCVQLYFAAEQQLQYRSDYFMQTYGVVPHFKAALHIGKVTVVEIGDVKRELAFHGDTMNTTARILSKCNSYNANLLASAHFLDIYNRHASLSYKRLGEIMLKGKAEPVEIVEVLGY